MSLLNRSALLVTLAPLEGNEDFDALSSATNILYVAAVAGLSASKRRKLPPRAGKGGRKASAGAGRRAGAGRETRRRERDPAPGKRESSQPGAGKEESFHREKKNLSKEEIVTC